MTYVLYEHYSDRNLATLIAELYGLNSIDIYFEIGKFIQREKYDEQTIQEYEAQLREKWFLRLGSRGRVENKKRVSLPKTDNNEL